MPKLYTSPLPARIHPDIDYSYDQLVEQKINYENYRHQKNESIVLDDFLVSAIQPLLSIESKKGHAAQSIKVVNCCRFILLNETLIRYAYNNRDDERIYKYLPKDKEATALRDFNDTSFHFVTKLEGNTECSADESLESLNALIKAFIDAILIAAEKDKIPELIDKLYFDENVGCLEARLRPAITYAKELKGRKLPRFEELFKPLYERMGENTFENYLLVLNTFEPHLGKSFLVEQDEKIIDEKFLLNYMEMQGQILSAEERSKFLIVRKIDVQQTLNLFKNEKALVKVIAAPLADPTNFNFILNQLIDPAGNRPVKKLYPGADRTRYLNPLTSTYQTRTVNAIRGAKKRADWKYTKKEATSLSPSDGKMKFFQVYDYSTILIFNIDECHLKGGKYIFPVNTASNSRWWVGANSTTKKTIAVTLDQLRAKNRENIRSRFIPAHNELLVGLTRNVWGIGIQKDTLEDRLNQIRIKQTLKTCLGRDVPILFLTGSSKVAPYSEEQQIKDIYAAKLMRPNTFAAQVLAAITDDFAKFIEDNYTNIKTVPAPALLVYERLLTLIKKNANTEQALIKYFDDHIASLNSTRENKKINDIFWYAVKNNLPLLAIKLLILNPDPGYKPQSDNNDNHSTFTLAVANDQTAIVEAILKKGISSSLILSTLFDLLQKETSTMYLMILSYLTLDQVKAWYSGDTKKSLLHSAISSMQMETIKKLAELNALNIYFHDENKKNAITLAWKSPKCDEILYILFTHLKFAKQGDAITFFYQMLERNKFELALLYVKNNNFRIEKNDIRLNKAFHFNVQNKNIEQAKELLALGACPNYEDVVQLAITLGLNELLPDFFKVQLKPAVILNALTSSLTYPESNVCYQLLGSVNCVGTLAVILELKPQPLMNHLKTNVLLLVQSSECTPSLMNVILESLIKYDESDLALDILDKRAELFNLSEYVEIKNTLLVEAAKYKRNSIAKVLLTLGADRNFTSDTAHTILRTSLQTGNTELLDHLLLAPEKLTAVSTIQATQFVATKNRLDLVKRIPNVEKHYADSETKEYCLHYAVRNCNTAMIINLCQLGGDIHAPNKSFLSPLDLAAEITELAEIAKIDVPKKQEMLLTLIQHGNFNSKSLHQSLLSLIKHNQTAAAIHLIISYPELSTEMAYVSRALKYAARKGNAKVVDVLASQNIPWNYNILVTVISILEKTGKPDADLENAQAALKKAQELALIRELEEYRIMRESELNQRTLTNKGNSVLYNSIFGKPFGYSATDKLNAVEKLIDKLNGDNVEFTSKELSALKSNRLGKIISNYKMISKQYLRNPDSVSQQVRPV